MERTKWIDGLRGIAATIVAFDRLFMDDMTFPFRSYWAQPLKKNGYWMQLPPFRIIFSAQAMITLFFVISGYATSINLLRVRHRQQLQQQHQQQHHGQTEFINQVASSATRRVFRLYLPVLIIACISQFFFFVNLYTFPTTADIKQFVLDNKIHPWSAPWGHISYLFRFMTDIINPFGALNYKHVNHGLNEQLWTMPAEFRGSCLVYFLVVIMAPWNAQKRLITLGVLATFFLWYGMWDIATFIGGLWLAEFKVTEEAQNGGLALHHHDRYAHDHPHHLQAEDSDEENVNSTLLQPSLSTSSNSSSSSTWSTWSGSLRPDSKRTRQLMTSLSITNILIFALGIHLMCLPESDNHLTNGYRSLFLITPRSWESWDVVQYSWKAIGAFMTVYAISNSPRWIFQRLLGSSSSLQYLGRLSFPLYLIQQIVFYLWREPVKNWIWKDLTGYPYPGGNLADREPFAWAVMWIGSTMILAPITVFLADEFVRYVEAPCMLATREIEKWFLE